MKNRRWLPLALSFLVSSPLLFFLAHFPQNPDGAEMVMTALTGGVLHPSGMPPQAWLNLIFARLSPSTPGWGLSFFSWLAHAGTCFILLATLTRLGVQHLAPRLLAIALYTANTYVFTMAIQPEKYAQVACTIALFLFFVVSALRDPDGPRRQNFWFIALSFSLALSQHTASVFLAPVLGVVFVSARRRHGLKRSLLWFSESTVLFAFITSAFYLSLLLLRSKSGWPDWGHLETASEIWQHFVRADFKQGLVAETQIQPVMINGLEFLKDALLQWWIALLLLPFGLLSLYRRERSIFFSVVIALISGCVLLWFAELPSSDAATARGYGERYPLILLPVLAILVGLGCADLKGRWAKPASLILVLSLGFTAWTGLKRNQATDNELIEIYRREVAENLPQGAILFSTSDFDLFYGFPCGEKTCFPIKNMFGMPWYRERAAGSVDARVPELLRSFSAENWNYAHFIRRAFHAGYTLASPNGQLFIEITDLRPYLEQRGLVWVVSRSNKVLYTDEILKSAMRLCQSLSARGQTIPQDSQYFAHEVLEKFRMVFQSAGDHLASGQTPELASRAYGVAQSLQPGQPKELWADRCAALLTLMR